MSHHLPSARVEHAGFAPLHTRPNPTNIPPPRHKKYRAKNILVIASGSAPSNHTVRKLVRSSSDSRRCHQQVEVFQVSSQVLQAVLDSCRRAHLGDPGTLARRQFLSDVMLCKRLRSIRLQNNLSLIELSKKSRVPLQVLADYEQGWQQPDQTTLERLALALHVQITELLSIATK